MKRLKARPCLECSEKKARLPKHEKTFCSVKCGFEWAVRFSGEYLECGAAWCEAHGCWYSSTQDDCTACNDTEREAERRGEGTRSCYTHGIPYVDNKGCPTCNKNGKETVAAYEGGRL